MGTNIAGHTAQTVAGASNFSLSAPPSRVLQQQQASSTFLTGKGYGKLRPAFAKSLAPLEVKKGGNQAYVHVQYVFKSEAPEAANSLEPITFTVSTPVPAAAAVSPLNKLDAAHQKKLLEDLGRLFKLPSPDRSDVSIEVDVKRHPYANLQVGDRWQEIHGAKDWEGLMEETLDPVFRGEVIRYGEFAQATYDAFDHDEKSHLCGNAKFDKDQLLREVGLLNRGYEISEFIYATADAHMPKFFRRKSTEQGDGEATWSKDSNFMGFVAVCNSPRELARLGRRDIVVAWRGTVTNLEWLENVRDVFSPAGLDPRGKSDVMVESGFLDVYKSKNENSRYNKLSAREQVLAAVRSLVQKHKDENLSISVTGHSLGSALSMLCAYDIAESGINKRRDSPKVPMHWDEPKLDAEPQPQPQQQPEQPEQHKEPLENRVPVSVFSFAGPRLGNSAFKARVEELGVKVLRVVNVHDVVPKVPGVIFNEKLEFLHNLAHWLPSSYVHVGKKLDLDSNVSEYLRDTTDPINAHNLEAYLHLLDGYRGPKAPFSPAVKRDVALVNKYSNFLEPKLGIPENWWEQKKMVRDTETGEWVVAQNSGPEIRQVPRFPRLPRSRLAQCQSV